MTKKKLNEISRLLNGYAFKSSKYVQSGLRVIRIANVQDGYLSDSDPCFYPIETTTELEQFLLKPHDLLMSLTGNVGRVAFIEKEYLPAGLNQRVECIRPFSEFDKEYLYYFFRSPMFQRESLKASHGSAQLNLSTVWLANFYVVYPDEEKRKTAVNTLRTIDNLIREKRNQLIELDALVKSRFIEMFGDPMDEKKWNSKFTEVVIFNPKKSEVKKDMEIEASFVPMEAIGTDGSFSIKKSGKIKDFYKGYTYFKDGDVIFAKITPCFENGKIAIANHCTNKIGFGTTEFHVARPISGKTNAEWVMNLLRNDSLHTYASSKMTGSAGQKRIQTPFFEKLGVYLPPLELQNRFADFVHLIDKS